MRVRLIKKTIVVQFAETHANGRTHFYRWLDIIDEADWDEPLHIRASYRADFIGRNRVIFDIGGNGSNAYRIICHYHFGKRKAHLYVNWIGTHEAYNRLTPHDKLNVLLY